MRNGGGSLLLTLLTITECSFFLEAAVRPNPSDFQLHGRKNGIQPASRTVKGKWVISIWLWFNFVSSTPAKKQLHHRILVSLSWEKKWWQFSHGGFGGVLNLIIWSLFIHTEPYQWLMMIYLYGLNVTTEDLRSKSYIHSRPWKHQEGLPATRTKVILHLPTFLSTLSGIWNYTITHRILFSAYFGWVGIEIHMFFKGDDFF